MVVIDTFADNMRELRMRAGLSQEMLAEKSGLHRTYIGSIEQRRANISLKNVEKIADALGVDPAVMFIDGVAARREVVDVYADVVDTLIEDAPRLAAGDYALCSWGDDGNVHVEPIGVYSEDLTLRLLCILVEEDYAETLEELVDAYERVSVPVLEFMRTFKGREISRRQELFAEKHGFDLVEFDHKVGEPAADDEDAPPNPFA